MRNLAYIKKAMYVLILLLISVVFFDSHAQTTKDSDYILLIDSDAETCAWSESVIPLIIKKLKEDHPELPIYTDYLLTISKTTEKDIEKAKEKIFSKYNDPPKYLLLMEATTYGILHEDIDKHWGENIPTVLLAREDYIGPEKYYINKQAIPVEERISLRNISIFRKNITVVYNPFDLSSTLALMKNLFPDMNKLSFVTDNRYISARLRHDLQHIISANYPELELSNITPQTHTTDELIHTLTTIPKNNGILYFTWSSNDTQSTESLIIESNIYRIFSLYTESPIFTINDIGLQESEMLGGSFTPYHQVAATYTDAVDYLINGMSGSRLVYCPTPVPTFNFPSLQEHNIPTTILPKNTLYYNKPLNFIEKNKNLLMGFGITLSLAIIFARIVVLSKTHKMQEKEIKLLGKYSDLIRYMPIGYQQGELVYDEQDNPIDYIVKETNPKCKTLLNIGDEFIGESVSRYYPEFVDILMNACKKNPPVANKSESLSYYHKATDRYFSIIISYPATPHIINIFFTETTELYHTQERLRVTNSKLQMSLEVAEITPWVWDVKKNYITYDINPNVPYYKRRIQTVEKEPTITPEEFFLCIHPDERGEVEEVFGQLIEGKIPKFKKEFQYSHTRLKEDYEWMELHATIKKEDKSGNVLSLAGSSLIITERKRKEQELKEARFKAEESNRLKSTFLANISHEIRTPLNAIVGFSSVLLSCDNDDEERISYANLIEENSDLLLKLVSDILDLSKIEAGSIDKQYSNIELNSFMEELQRKTKEKANSNVQVIFNKKDKKCLVHTEKKWLTQVLFNLLDNAAKFTETGSIQFGYSFKDEERLHFYVKDTGVGIPATDKQRIFEHFIKLDYFIQGAGLGLSVCEAIIQQFGGTINLETEEGKGSVFAFTFPYFPIKETIEV